MCELISIIIPVYNSADTIEKCICSLQKQTYNNLQIIIIDDGSSDNSYDICYKMQKQDNRIFILKKENKGVSSARNLGVKIADGKYITFVDSDDLIDFDYIETLYNKIKQYDADVVVSNGADLLNGEIKYSGKKHKDILLNGEKCIKELLNEKLFYSTCWGKLYKAEIVKNCEFDEEMYIAEDLKYLISVFFFCQKVVITDIEKYFYNQRQGSAIRSGFNEKWILEINYCMELIKQYKNTELEYYAIKRYIRVNETCLLFFKISYSDYSLLKNNIKQFKYQYMRNKLTTPKEKFKIIIIFYAYWLILIRRKLQGGMKS